MTDRMRCYRCGHQEFDSDSGYYYCSRCNTQVDDIAETGIADEDLRDTFYSQTHRSKLSSQIKTEPQTQQLYRIFSQHKPPKQEPLDDQEPFGPSDFASDFASEAFTPIIRIMYVEGIQRTIQFQCQALVENFGVSPLICGLVGVIWLRFVAVSRVFDENWVDDTIIDSEMRKQGDPNGTEEDKKLMIWFRSLRKRIPISISLAISFLACHVAREVILPTDIVKWALEGKLPYLTAFVDIEKSTHPTKPNPTSCPFTASFMFRPSHVVRPKELEAHAGFVAQRIGLQLPPVNFHAIARRYLIQLSLPVEKILPYASHIHEWAMPPDLWLSANLHRLPTRVCVMSILLIAIRILYNINGFGKWEESLCCSESSTASQKVEKSSSRYKFRECTGNAKQCSQSFDSISKPESTPKSRKTNKSVEDPKNKPNYKNDAAKSRPSSNLHEIGTLRGLSSMQNSEFDAAQLLCRLETMHEKICHDHEYLKDLRTYLNYCKKVVFAGETCDDYEEERIIKQLWEFYEKQEDEGCIRRKPRDDTEAGNDGCTSSTPLDTDGDAKQSDSAEKSKDRALRRMKVNMEENGFVYIPPRVKLKRFDYLHYIRKNDEGCRSNVAHADYYILLRACAQVVQVNVGYMHAAVLRLEKRLAWIENRIDQSLQWRAHNPSPDREEAPQDMDDDSLEFSD